MKTVIKTPKSRKPSRPTGYVLHEDSRIVVIATLESDNEKTGNMIQIWILDRTINPVAAVQSGADTSVCLDCKHRGTGKKDRTCYVRVANAPLGIWRAYHRHRYPFLQLEQYSAVFAGCKVRFGAYGEPVLIPVNVVAAVAAVSAGWTGYTHQWRTPGFAGHSRYLMASCDTIAEHAAAKAAGWRVFRVREEGAPLLPGEIMCPASPEGGHKSQCERCKLCSGTYAGDPRKDIGIEVHGANKSKFIQLIASIN
jgi:hypothetical protein